MQGDAFHYAYAYECNIQITRAKPRFLLTWTDLNDKLLRRVQSQGSLKKTTCLLTQGTHYRGCRQLIRVQTSLFLYQQRQRSL